jgi:hypothetical protein
LGALKVKLSSCNIEITSIDSENRPFPQNKGISAKAPARLEVSSKLRRSHYKMMHISQFEMKYILETRDEKKTVEVW